MKNGQNKRKYRNKAWLDKKSRNGNKKQKNKIIKKVHYRKSSSFSYRMIAPEKFSIIDNAELNITEFNNLINNLKQKKFKKYYYIDLSKVIQITIDAVMYLCAVVNNIKLSNKYNVQISGNLPQDEKAKKFVKESGFLSYVKSNDDASFYKTTDKIQIFSGSNDSNTNAARRICDFTTKILKVEQPKIRFLFNTINELAQNTVQHAYDKNVAFEKVWYIYAEDCVDIIKYTFLDTGVGIPHTIRKNIFENTLLKKKDCEYLISALRGEKRTQTKQDHRGEGLKEIYGYVKERSLNNFFVISGNGMCKIINGNENLSENTNELVGTIYYWEIKKENN